jgi:hypothetical protein
VPFKSVKVNEVTYNEIGELQEILVQRGMTVLPESTRPGRASFDGIVLAAVRAMRRRVRR